MAAIKSSSIRRQLKSAKGSGAMPMQNKPTLRVLLSGLIASLTMYGFFYTLPTFGLNQMNVVGLLSTLSARDFLWAAPLQYMALSVVVFPLLFARLFYDNIPGKTPWEKGFSWGIILWTLRGLIVLPVMGEGLFSMDSQHWVESMILTFIGHALYGIVLGALLGDQSNSTVYRQRRQASKDTIVTSRQ